jgi:nucleoside-diphosphate-sugar epimerase
MILVTGATGLTGHFLIQELVRRKCPMRALVRNPPKFPTPPGVEVVPGDLGNPDSLCRALHGATGVIHAASASNFPPGADSLVDIDAMQTLLAGWGDGPFVFLSSVDVYGWPHINPVTEDHPRLTPYAWGKIRCEELLRRRADERNRRDHSILRPPHIWAPHPRCRDRLVTSRLSQGLPIVLPGATLEDRARFGDSWVDARALAWACVECLERPLGGEANVVSGHFLWGELFAELIVLTGSVSRLEHRPLAEIGWEELDRAVFYAQNWRYSGELLKRHLGPLPAHDWRETVREAILRPHG